MGPRDALILVEEKVDRSISPCLVFQMVVFVGRAGSRQARCLIHDSLSSTQYTPHNMADTHVTCDMWGGGDTRDKDASDRERPSLSVSIRTRGPDSGLAGEGERVSDRGQGAGPGKGKGRARTQEVMRDEGPGEGTGDRTGRGGGYGPAGGVSRLRTHARTSTHAGTQNTSADTRVGVGDLCLCYIYLEAILCTRIYPDIQQGCIFSGEKFMRKNQKKSTTQRRAAYKYILYYARKAECSCAGGRTPAADLVPPRRVPDKHT